MWHYTKNQNSKKFAKIVLSNKNYGKDVILSLKEFYIKPKSLFLDIGCGPGKIANLVENEFKIKVIALDVDREMLKIAKKFTCNRVLADGCLLPFKNEIFHGLYARFISIDFKKLFYEIERVLKPNGVVCLKLFTKKDNPEIHKIIEGYRKINLSYKKYLQIIKNARLNVQRYLIRNWKTKFQDPSFFVDYLKGIGLYKEFVKNTSIKDFLKTIWSDDEKNFQLSREAIEIWASK